MSVEGIKWNDSYKLGDERVDGQHKQLFELLSKLVASCEDGSELIKIQDALDFLVNYAVQHFNDEELLQLECDYPDYERHRALHEAFKVTVTDLVKRFVLSGSSMELSSDLNKIVVRWLISHIQGEDKKISAYIKQTPA